MKKLGILILLTAFGTAAMAQMKWYSFEEAVALSEKKPRKIFIDVYTDWCGWCKVMDRNTFSNPSIAEYMNKNYYSVKLNAEMTDTVRFKGHIFVNPGSGRRSSHQLAVSLLNGKMSFPSVVFMNEQFQILQVLPGYQSPEQFPPIMVYLAENIYEKKTWDDFRKDFKWEGATGQK